MWVREDANSCDSQFRLPGMGYQTMLQSYELVVQGNATSAAARNRTNSTNPYRAITNQVHAVFDFSTYLNASGRRAPFPTTTLILCYKFNYASRPDASQSSYILFPHIAVAVVRFKEVMPWGTGVGCSSNLTITGSGFNQLPADQITCNFTGLGTSVAHRVNDTTLLCSTPIPKAVQMHPLRLVVNASAEERLRILDGPPDFSYFGSYDVNARALSNAVTPAGGPFNLEANVSLVVTGTQWEDWGFETWGKPRCRFGGNGTTSGFFGLGGRVINRTHAVCDKPVFPDSERYNVGAYLIAFSANGQCFPQPNGTDSSMLSSSVPELLSPVPSSVHEANVRRDGLRVIPADNTGLLTFPLYRDNCTTVNINCVDKLNSGLPSAFVALSTCTYFRNNPAACAGYSSARANCPVSCRTCPPPIVTCNRYLVFERFGRQFHENTTAGYVSYNAQVNDIGVRGAPSTTSVMLDIAGEGFAVPSLRDAICRYKLLSTSAGALMRNTTTNTTRCRISPNSTIWTNGTNSTISTNGTVCETTVTDVTVPSSIEFPLQTVSPTLVRCPTPSTGFAARWGVQVLCSGAFVERTLYGSDPVFEEYDLAKVRVHEVIPTGGVTGRETRVTVVGSGFASYGQNQLICRVGTSATVPGFLLNSTHIICNLPGSDSEAQICQNTCNGTNQHGVNFASDGECDDGGPGSEYSDDPFFTTCAVGTDCNDCGPRMVGVPVTVSLNNGTVGTFSGDSRDFVYYHAPYLASIFPTEGAARGGTTVTLNGLGFLALTPGASVNECQRLCLQCPGFPPGQCEECAACNALIAMRSDLVRCRFGQETQHLPPMFVSDTQVVCNTTWGAGPQPVSLALNRVSFMSRVASQAMPRTSTYAIARADSVPQFRFVGLHTPVLLEAHFDVQGTRLIIRFDSQPTNRGGFNGRSPCSLVLDNTTASQIRGEAPTEAYCDWLDDWTLFAELTMLSHASKGMTVTVKSNVIWPHAFVGTCSAADALCFRGATVRVDDFFPCDRRATDEREMCITPRALIQAPSVIGSCPGTTVMLDASRSTGGGARPLSFQWSASPRTCDNLARVSLALGSVSGGTTSIVTLGGAELDGGSRFDFVLVVANFLGSISAPYPISITRATVPVPSVTIMAPPLVSIPVSSLVPLEASARIPGCFSSAGGTDLVFTWTHERSARGATVLNMSAAPLTLGETSTQRTLYVRGSTLERGITYTLRATACLSASNTTCGSYAIDVELKDEPLLGAIADGDRTVGALDPFVLDACASTDADDALATCNADDGFCDIGLWNGVVRHL